MKKKAIIATSIAGILLLGGGTVYAAGQIARSNAITEETARNFAYVDAGVLPEEAEVKRTEFDFENGKFVYDIEFTADGVKYEYTVDSSNGTIIEKESENLPGKAQNETTPKPDQQPAEKAPEETPEPQAPEAIRAEDPKPDQQPAEKAPEETSVPQASEMIGVDKAKEIALKKAGLSAENVVFRKAKQEHDDGRQIYDIEFYVSGQTEYEYEIDAYSGTILEEDIDPWEEDD